MYSPMRDAVTSASELTKLLRIRPLQAPPKIRNPVIMYSELKTVAPRNPNIVT
jgi:hypothetical protein